MSNMQINVLVGLKLNLVAQNRHHTGYFITSTIKQAVYLSFLDVLYSITYIYIYLLEYIVLDWLKHKWRKSHMGFHTSTDIFSAVKTDYEVTRINMSYGSGQPVRWRENS